MKWTGFLEDKLETCLIDSPFAGAPKSNVLMSGRYDGFETCMFQANSALKTFKEASYFFWSPSKNPSGTIGGGNCYLFRSCARRSSLNSVGNTYKRGILFYNLLRFLNIIMALLTTKF